MSDPGEFDDLDLLDLDPEVTDITVYVPPGPASLEFLNHTAPFVAIMGPVGQGKTTTAAFKRISDGAEQGLGRDGWVRDRCLVLRRTWRTAKRTVLRSWQEWFRKGYPGSTWTGGEDRPAMHTLRFEDPTRFGSLNPVKIELETEFLGLDDNTMDAILSGAQYSRIWLNEADQFSDDALAKCEERVGRYPQLAGLADGQKRTRQVTGDFNAPDKTNYLYDLLIEHPTPNRQLVTAPPGLIVEWNADGTLKSFKTNPLAENLDRLDADYYTSKAETWEDWRIRRLILNEWGYSRAGLPVFLVEFREHLHVAPTIIDPNPKLPLAIGVDGSTAGLRPAAVFMQPDSTGHLNVIETVAPGHGCGAIRFWTLVRATFDARYRGCPAVEIWSDPASQYGGDKEGGQMSFIDTGMTIMEMAVRVPAGGSNEIGMRLDAIRNELTAVIDGERRRLRISPDPSNRILIHAFMSNYCFQRRPSTAPTTWEPVPRKNEASDPMDACGYGILGWRRIMPSTVARDGGWRASAAPPAPREPKDDLAGARKDDFDVFRL